MSQDITRMRVVYELPAEGTVAVHSEMAFSGADGSKLAMDVYYPAETVPRPLPAVVLIAGYPDPGFQRALGCRFKDMQSSISWARVLAASGLAVVTYTNREPVADLHAVLRHLQPAAASLNLDTSRLGIWASSGHVPLALSLLMNDAPTPVRCATLLYGYTLDLNGATGVAEVSAKVGFVNACAGKSIADFQKNVPMFVARAGQDAFPHLNDALDRMVYEGLRANLPLTVVNHPTGPHAFDLVDPSETSREIVRRASAFLGYHLLTVAAQA